VIQLSGREDVQILSARTSWSGEKELAMTWLGALTQTKKGRSSRRANGFSLIELLIVVAIILIIAAIAIPNLLRSRMAANEAATSQNMRTIITAEAAYSTTYGIGFSATLADLGNMGGPLGPLAADLIESDLALGTKSGYTYTYVSSPPVGGIIYDYKMNTDPISVGSTGQRHFYTDQTGVIRQNTVAVAGPGDPPI
jgi:prepilin-type N-terminal cleavage/methylation domain-containing protein